MSTFTTYLGICLAGHLLLPWDRGTQEALLQDLGWQLPHAGKGTKQPFPASCCKKSTVMLAMLGHAYVVLECTSQMWSWTVSTFGLAEVLEDAIYTLDLSLCCTSVSPRLLAWLSFSLQKNAENEIMLMGRPSCRYNYCGIPVNGDVHISIVCSRFTPSIICVEQYCMYL